MHRIKLFGRLPMVGMGLAVALSFGATPTVARAQGGWDCFDSYLLLTGRCPDRCSHGEACPCYTCVRAE